MIASWLVRRVSAVYTHRRHECWPVPSLGHSLHCDHRPTCSVNTGHTDHWPGADQGRGEHADSPVHGPQHHSEAGHSGGGCHCDADDDQQCCHWVLLPGVPTIIWDIVSGLGTTLSDSSVRAGPARTSHPSLHTLIINEGLCLLTRAPAQPPPTTSTVWCVLTSHHCPTLSSLSSPGTQTQTNYSGSTSRQSSSPSLWTSTSSLNKYFYSKLRKLQDCVIYVIFIMALLTLKKFCRWTLFWLHFQILEYNFYCKI